MSFVTLSEALQTQRLEGRRAPSDPKAWGNRLSFLEDNEWKGKDCFIVGGGPSLLGFDFSCLLGRKVICLNDSWAHVGFDPDIVVAMDRSFAFSASERISRAETQVTRLVFIDTVGRPLPVNGEVLLTGRRSGILTSSFSEGIGHGGNSGFAGLNIALNLGCRRIFLLGFDMHLGKNGNLNFYEKFTARSKVSLFFLEWLTYFNMNADLANNRAEILNMGIDSELGCFDKYPLSSLGGLLF